MEPTVNNERNLHPVWYRHFGIQPVQPTRKPAPPRNAADALIRAVQVLAAKQPTTR